MVSIAVAGGRRDPAARGPDRAAHRSAAALADPDGAAPSWRRARRGARSRTWGSRARASPPATGRAAATASGAAAGCAGCARPWASCSPAAAGPAPPSLLDTAIDRAGEAAGMPLERLSTTVFESGRVVVCLRASDGENVLHAACRGSVQAPARRVARGGGGGGRRERAAGGSRPSRDPARRRGSVGPLRYSFEPNAVGTHPWRMTADLWEDALEFLVALFGVDVSRQRDAGGGELRRQGERMMEYVGEEEREALPSILANLEGGSPTCRAGRATATSGRRTSWCATAGSPRCSTGSGPPRRRCRCSTSST